MDNLCNVHGVPDMFGKENDLQKPENAVVLDWCAPPLP
jgi:hypothetical protein